jgi:hypothetical protein
VLDRDTVFWKPVPAGHVVVARQGEGTMVQPSPPDIRLAAE